MKHRRLLIGSIISIPIGLILWMVIGPVIALAGVSQHYEGFWPFGSTVTDITATYWIGLAIGIIGICILAFGIVGIILAFVLEYLDKTQTKQSAPRQ